MIWFNLSDEADKQDGKSPPTVLSLTLGWVGGGSRRTDRHLFFTRVVNGAGCVAVTTPAAGMGETNEKSLPTPRPTRARLRSGVADAFEGEPFMWKRPAKTP
ncbi:hypothetical protein ISCGN_018988 [Ixodes scapularis]